MTEEKQIIALAKLDGFYKCNCCGRFAKDKKHVNLPDYFNDYNQIARLEQILTHLQREKYTKLLTEISRELKKGESRLAIESDFVVVTAKPWQRIKAFLMVKGVWEKDL